MIRVTFPGSPATYCGFVTCHCGHSDADHVLLSACQEQVHYPDEDYPCMCADFAPGSDAVLCAECGHKRERHLDVMRCKQPLASACSCTRLITAAVS
ncbi:MAG TPA: hypothetical protein VIL97_02830 [Thermoanaerobaculia bacterium]